MTIVFYISAIIAVIATLAAITSLISVHAILYFILSLLSVGIIFFVLGAPFVSALIVIINAGAIMVLFVFIIMMVNQEKHTVEQEKISKSPTLILPGFLAVILLAEIFYIISTKHGAAGSSVIGPKQVGMALFGPYLAGVELVSLLLLAGLMGALHLARESHVVIKHKGKNIG